jgi:hypothetical protein
MNRIGTALEDALFDKLKKSPAAAYIRVVKELNVDFIGNLAQDDRFL